PATKESSTPRNSSVAARRSGVRSSMRAPLLDGAEAADEGCTLEGRLHVRRAPPAGAPRVGGCELPLAPDRWSRSCRAAGVGRGHHTAGAAAGPAPRDDDAVGEARVRPP